MVNGVSHAVVAASILSQASELMRGHRTLIGQCPWLAPACTEYQDVSAVQSGLRYRPEVQSWV